MSDPVQYVRLTARPDTWYKAGTEVFWEGSVLDNWTARRPTIDEWESLKQPENAGIGCVGIRVCGDNPNERGNGWAPGFERWDGEWCAIDEFDVEVVNESKDAP